ncbi:hypothetical protein [uncultured Anaerococcus sp.]|uniref:hypothetical protein n=1 Tax=uncultured Anaerococcus sp. TaxID=293428 RepID=UPI00280415C4|nr:hypothetical protein [uncultured Anaerococcus sp.]
MFIFNLLDLCKFTLYKIKEVSYVEIFYLRDKKEFVKFLIIRLIVIGFGLLIPIFILLESINKDKEKDLG